MIKVSENNIESNFNIKNVLKGSIVSIIITLVFIFIFSIILTYTSVKESSIPVVVIVATGISILIGSQMSTLNMKKNGIINGGAVGLIYIIFIYLLSSIISGNFLLNTNSIIMMIASIIAGCLGGIIGVNMK